MHATVQDDLLAVIDSAITSQRVVQIKSSKGWRTVEPYIAGLHKDTQALCLYGFCRDVIPSAKGEENVRWQLFYLDNIETIELTLYGFQPHTEYTGDYDPINFIYFKVKPW